MVFKEHPTVIKVRRTLVSPANQVRLDIQWLHRVVLTAEADDVRFVESSRAELADERPYIRRILLAGRSLVSFVVTHKSGAGAQHCATARHLEFHHVDDRVGEIARHITPRRALQLHRPESRF